MNQREIQRNACAFQLAVQTQSRRSGESGASWSPRLFAGLGQKVMRAVRPNMGLSACLQGMWDLADEDMEVGDLASAAMLRSMLVKPPDNVMLVACGRWARSGFPQVAMGHKYGAALMATSVPAAMLEDVRPPWEAFVIQVPHGLVHLMGQHGLLAVRFVMVTREPTGEWSYVACCDPEPQAVSDTVYYQNLNTTEGILDPTSIGTARAEQIGDFFARDMDPVDDRAAKLLGKLVLNVCLAMSDPSNVKPPAKVKESKLREKRSRGEPIFRTYTLGKPIKLDCRAAVAAYSRGERQPPSVQVLVRGHWKRQACGAGRADRRLIWIEPYWRGPEDGPINVRSHDVQRQP